MALSKFLAPKNDVAFKKVFGSEKHKDILIHFINDILEFKGNEQIEEVEFLSPIQDAEIASKKQSIVDVLCKDKNGVQIIVEMQIAPTKGFEKRAQYYAAKAYSRQLNSGSEENGKYQNLKEVIFIAIADCIIFQGKTAYKSDHVILDKNSHEHDLQDFSFTFIELPKFKKTNISELSTILEKWCFFFKNAAKTSEEDLEKLIGSDLVIKQAYDALSQFNWSEPELIAYDQEIKRIRDNIAALDYQYDKGIEKGIERGKTERDIEIAKGMIFKNYPLSDISSLTGLSIAELQKLKSSS
jgi:predicted transposase/invertase (TIGR01784 family)